MPTSNGLAESAQQQSIASRRPECIVPVLLWQLTAASIDGGGDVQQARATLAQLRDRAAEWPEGTPCIRMLEI
uniref:DUF5107 domain-containing protein n=1 Tax=Macrostomum lignano TaxID=282301 RepID=A0A1I8FJP4_9PLAT